MVEQLVETVLCHGQDMGQFPMLGDGHQPIKRELHKCPSCLDSNCTNPESRVMENPRCIDGFLSYKL